MIPPWKGRECWPSGVSSVSDVSDPWDPGFSVLIRKTCSDNENKNEHLAPEKT